MKFTDGFWQLRPGVEALYAEQAYEVAADDRSLTVTAPTKVVRTRGDTLNRPTLTVTLTSPMADVIGVRIDHWRGARHEPGFALRTEDVDVHVDGDARSLRSGALVATVGPGAPWSLEFTAGGRVLTSSGAKSIGYMRLADDAEVDPGRIGNARSGERTSAPRAHLLQQLDLDVGELVYGLGERFGPVVKNGQSVELWNADGGTSSEQAYKNVPFFMTNRGYGVFVDHPGHVSVEIGSEAVQRSQFSVAGESLQYYVIHGPSPKAVLERYTALTGRPARVPAWSWGLWLTTSFTTSYDEQTVGAFIEGMAERDLPLSVLHFDCFWMRGFDWCDFTWDERTFPDPEGMLQRLHDAGLRVCVWINPYIAQRSRLFDEAAEAGYLLRRPNGDVWQWDLWQAGMGIVDFTNPAAKAWYQGHLRRLLRQGVDCFKTDFGERIPLDVRWADGSSPDRMHNLYAQRYNEAVFEVLEQERGTGEAVVFARSATAGGQRLPVHWGGDSTSTYASMAETLRGGLSLAFSGFGFWSHDIGGFEGEPDPGVFKRWVAFGLLSSHSRLHGSDSVRVPWAFDDEAVEVTRRFTKLKMRLMPYLLAAGEEAVERGTPVMRPMQLEFPDDPGVAHLDRQYMLGADLLVAPVFSDERVELYLPAGRWTRFFTGEAVSGGGWREERHDFSSLPLYVREGAVLPLGAHDDRPDHDPLTGLTLAAHPGPDGVRTVRVPGSTGGPVEYTVTRRDGTLTAAGPSSGPGFELLDVQTGRRARSTEGLAVLSGLDGSGS